MRAMETKNPTPGWWQHARGRMAAALAAAVFTPFGLYWALEAGLDWLAAGLFGLVGLAFAVVLLEG